MLPGPSSLTRSPVRRQRVHLVRVADWMSLSDGIACMLSEQLQPLTMHRMVVVVAAIGFGGVAVLS